MAYKDFPFGMRVLLAATAIFFVVSAVIFLAGITAIVGLLSNKGVHPSAWAAVATLIGAALGVFGTLLVTRHMATVNREKEAGDVAASLHAGIADRAARCLNDYLTPWQRFVPDTYNQPKVPPRTWINKFRPIDPVVYPAVASKMGLLKPDALFCVLQFYFRLGVVQREIDDILNDDDFFNETQFPKVRKRLARVTDRFKAVFGPAARALNSLGVTNAARIENAAAKAYPHVHDANLLLREGLEANKKVDP